MTHSRRASGSSSNGGTNGSLNTHLIRDGDRSKAGITYDGGKPMEPGYTRSAAGEAGCYRVWGVSMSQIFQKTPLLRASHQYIPSSERASFVLVRPQARYTNKTISSRIGRWATVCSHLFAHAYSDYK